MRRLTDLELAGKRVLIRVDFNVPLDPHQRVTSDARIRAALPTIRAVLAAGGKAILMSHLGRPGGRVVESLRLRPAAERLAALLGQPVASAGDCIGEPAQRAVLDLHQGACLVLENLRFHPGETACDPRFVEALASLGDVYINDAFGTAHRAHASVSGVPGRLPGAVGLLMEQELAAFAKVLQRPQRPFVAILGGAKVSDKLPVIINLLDLVDSLIIGGAMAYTFLAQQGVAIGKSLLERELLEEAGRVQAQAEARGVSVLLPVDHVCATELSADAEVSHCQREIPADSIGLDIGPETIANYRAVIASAGSIIWNGPMGVFEIPAFRRGTEAIGRAVAESRAWSVVGGGDSVAALDLLGLRDKVSHVSTGGGAGLELLQGRTLPGIAALECG